MDEDLEDLSVSQIMHLDPEAPLVIDGAKPGGKVSAVTPNGHTVPASKVYQPWMVCNQGYLLIPSCLPGVQ